MTKKKLVKYTIVKVNRYLHSDGKHYRSGDSIMMPEGLEKSDWLELWKPPEPKPEPIEESEITEEEKVVTIDPRGKQADDHTSKKSSSGSRE